MNKWVTLRVHLCLPTNIDATGNAKTKCPQFTYLEEKINKKNK